MLAGVLPEHISPWLSAWKGTEDKYDCMVGVFLGAGQSCSHMAGVEVSLSFHVIENLTKFCIFCGNVHCTQTILKLISRYNIKSYEATSTGGPGLRII